MTSSTRTPISNVLSDTDKQTATGGALQDCLVDLIGLALVGKQAHWNVIGPQFRSVHLQLDELVALAREHADAVAERAASIGVSADGRPAVVSRDTGVPEFGEGWRADVEVVRAVVEILEGLIARFRHRIEETENTDLVTQDLLIAVAGDLEKAHWMWQAQVPR
ncbi:MAG: Dps family protein [Pseudonocardiaceae bacterium]